MRLLSVLLLLAAVFFLGQALWPLVTGGGYDPAIFGTVWSQIEPKSLIGIGKGLEPLRIGEFDLGITIYQTLIVPVLSAPIWIVCGVLGALLFALSWIVAARR